jgi:epoxide hydrolase-like predicted phosphatase
MRAVSPRRADALLIDYGGVLTSSVFESFDAFCRKAGLPDGVVRELFRADPDAQGLMAAVEVGELSPEVFEESLADLLSRGRTPIEAAGLIDRLFGAARPEHVLLDAVATLRGAGVRTVLVSNSLGFAAYETLDIERLFDDVVLSGKVGLRKPDPRIYELAAARAGVPPHACVFVDDLGGNLRPAAELGMTTIKHREAAETLTLLERAFRIPLASGRPSD